MRSIELGRQSTPMADLDSTNVSYARYVGRVGALAVALGVGSAVAAIPVALADTTGSAGSTGSTAADSRSASSTASKGRMIWRFPPIDP